MVVRLRLQRFGQKNRPFYRMVAADARAPRDGKFLEIVSNAYINISPNKGSTRTFLPRAFLIELRLHSQIIHVYCLFASNDNIIFVFHFVTNRLGHIIL